MAAKIKKGDRVVVLTGKDKGRQGNVLKVLPKDEQGRLNLSRREALIEVEGLTPENDLSEENQHRGGRRDFGRRPHRSDRR